MERQKVTIEEVEGKYYIWGQEVKFSKNFSRTTKSVLAIWLGKKITLRLEGDGSTTMALAKSESVELKKNIRFRVRPESFTRGNKEKYLKNIKFDRWQKQDCQDYKTIKGRFKYTKYSEEERLKALREIVKSVKIKIGFGQRNKFKSLYFEADPKILWNVAMLFQEHNSFKGYEDFLEFLKDRNEGERLFIDSISGNYYFATTLGIYGLSGFSPERFRRFVGEVCEITGSTALVKYEKYEKNRLLERESNKFIRVYSSSSKLIYEKSTGEKVI